MKPKSGAKQNVGGKPYFGGYDDDAQDQDFSIAATPALREVFVPSNQTANYTVDIRALYGFALTVNLSVSSGLPPHVTPTFTPPSITAQGSSTLKITVSNQTPAGLFKLTITGDCEGYKRDATVKLNIISRNPPSAWAPKIPGRVIVKGPVPPAPGDPVEE